MTQHRSGGDRSTRTRRNQAPLPKNPRRGPAAGAQREGACRAPCDCVYAARESERASETACARASTDRQATAATHQSSLQPLIEQPTGSEGARDLVTDVTDSAHEPQASRDASQVKKRKKCREGARCQKKSVGPAGRGGLPGPRGGRAGRCAAAARRPVANAVGAVGARAP